MLLISGKLLESKIDHNHFIINPSQERIHNHCFISSLTLYKPCSCCVILI